MPGCRDVDNDNGRRGVGEGHLSDWWESRKRQQATRLEEGCTRNLCLAWLFGSQICLHTSSCSTFNLATNSLPQPQHFNFILVATVFSLNPSNRATYRTTNSDGFPIRSRLPCDAWSLPRSNASPPPTHLPPRFRHAPFLQFLFL